MGSTKQNNRPKVRLNMTSVMAQPPACLLRGQPHRVRGSRGRIAASLLLAGWGPSLPDAPSGALSKVNSRCWDRQPKLSLENITLLSLLTTKVFSVDHSSLCETLVVRNDDYMRTFPPAVALEGSSGVRVFQASGCLWPQDLLL